jgi:hypothetical protein
VGLVVAAVGIGAVTAGVLLGSSEDEEGAARLTIVPGDLVLSGSLP